MTAFPCRVPVGHEVFSATGATDAHGNDVPSWAPAVTKMVFGLEPAKSTESSIAGHDRVVVDARMHALVSFGAKPQDRVLYNGTRFEVIGWPEDPNANPWWSPGMVIVNLKVVEG